MVCPYCHKDTQVRNSRPRRNNFSVWRRRYCKHCQLAFTTIETITLESIINIKDSKGNLKPLRYSDIHISIFKALEGLNEQIEACDYLAQNCLDKIFKYGQAVIPLQILRQILYETLNSYQKLAGQRYLVNEQIDNIKFLK